MSYVILHVQLHHQGGETEQIYDNKIWDDLKKCLTFIDYLESQHNKSKNKRITNCFYPAKLILVPTTERNQNHYNFDEIEVKEALKYYAEQKRGMILTSMTAPSVTEES